MELHTAFGLLRTVSRPSVIINNWLHDPDHHCDPSTVNYGDNLQCTKPRFAGHGAGLGPQARAEPHKSLAAAGGHSLDRGYSNASEASATGSFRDDISLADGFCSEAHNQDDDTINDASQATWDTDAMMGSCLGSPASDSESMTAKQHLQHLAGAVPAEGSSPAPSSKVSKKNRKTRQLMKQGSLPRQGSLTRQGSLKRRGSLQRKRREAARLAVAAAAAASAAGTTAGSLSSAGNLRPSRLSRCSQRVREEVSEAMARSTGEWVCLIGVSPSGKTTTNSNSQSQGHDAEMMQRALDSPAANCSSAGACRQAGSPPPKGGGTQAGIHQPVRVTASSCQLRGHFPSTGSDSASPVSDRHYHDAAEMLADRCTSAPFRMAPLADAGASAAATAASAPPARISRRSTKQREDSSLREEGPLSPSPSPFPSGPAPSTGMHSSSGTNRGSSSSSSRSAGMHTMVMMQPEAARQQRPPWVPSDSDLALISRATPPSARLVATTAMQVDGVTLPVEVAAAQHLPLVTDVQPPQGMALPSLQRSRCFREGASGSKRVPAKMKQIIQRWIEVEEEVPSAPGIAYSRSDKSASSAGYRIGGGTSFYSEPLSVTVSHQGSGRLQERRQMALEPIVVAVRPVRTATAGNRTSPGSAPSRVLRSSRPKYI